MKIISIEIKNDRAIKCFNLELNGNNLEVAGDTATGKTTAISALWNIVEKRGDCLTHGERKGSIKIVLGDGDKTIYAKRINTRSSSTITLASDDGEKISIRDFKQMISDLSINPHKIMSMKPTERTKNLLKAADLGDVDLDDIELSITFAEEKRLELHRKASFLKPGDPPEKVKSVSITDLLLQRDRLEKINAENERIRSSHNILLEKRIAYANDLNAIGEQIKFLEESLEKAKEQRNSALSSINAHDEKMVFSNNHLKGLSDQDLSEINYEISQVESTNITALVYQQWQKKEEEYEDIQMEYTDASRLVKELREQKSQVLDGAKWPIDGLFIQDGDIIYNDCLIENLGESDQMLVCAALSIADIKAHDLKVVRIDGVESMDIDNFKKLQKLFNDSGIQVLSTRVSRGDIDPQEIVIVDGEYSDGE